MSNKKFTKGKWTIKESPTLHIKSKHGLICEISYTGDGTAIPNARLISAAPEMLEALKEMVRMYEEIEPCGGYQGVYESAISAIEKAVC